MLRWFRWRVADAVVGPLGDHLHDGVAVQDSSGELLLWTEAAATMTGWDRDEAQQRLTELVDGPNDVRPVGWISARRVEVRRWGVRFVVTVMTDARESVALRQAYAELHDLSTTDRLTGLPNRALAEDRLAVSLELARRDRKSVGVIMVDLDRFRVVNESLGTAVGDRVLRTIADRLRSAVRDGDTVARVGGDQFLVVLHHMSDQHAAARTADAIADAMRGHIDISGQEVWLTASIGVAVITPHRDGEVDVIGLANRATALCKADGGNGVRSTCAREVDAVDRLTLAAELHRAVLNEALSVHYQPQYDTDSGAIAGVEALVRWDHPRLGMIGPDRFLPISYEDGLIVEIDRWVLNTACRQAVRWRVTGIDIPTIAVNLSARTLCSDGVVSMVAGALAASGLAPRRLEIEVSEHVVASNSEVAEARLRELRQLGVQVAIDDFGTGYSSLAHLKRFPLDTIKLDRGFVIDISEEPTRADIAILRSVITLAADLRLRCVAEGVETPGQRRLLRYLRCHLMQGHLYAPALPAESVSGAVRQLADEIDERAAVRR